MGATVGSEAQEVSPEKAKKGNKKSNKKGAKSAATGTPSGEAPLKKDAVRKKAAASKKDTRKKIATKNSAGKDKTAAGRKRKSSQDKPGAVPGRPPAPDEARVKLPAAGAPVTTGMPGAVSAGPPPGDPNSLSWMAAQAVKALNAVKVAQAEQAAAERASQKAVETAETTRSAGAFTPETAETKVGNGKGDIPAVQDKPAKAAAAAKSQKPRKSGKRKRVEQAVVADLAAIAPAPEGSAGTPPVQGEPVAATAHAPEAGRIDVAAGNGVASTVSKTPAPGEAVAGERPVPLTESDQLQPEQIAPGDAPVTPPAHELTAAATRRRSALRPIVIVGLVAVVGVLAYRYWNTGQDALPTAPLADESRAGQTLEPPASGEVAAVIGPVSPAPPSVSVPLPVSAPLPASAPAAKTEPAEPVAPAAIATEQEQAAQAALVIPLEAADPQEPESSTAVVATPRETQTAEPEPAQPQPKAPAVAAAVEQPARPAPPPQRYAPPGYGYYPPPASWPRYYGPAYPQPPSR